MFLLIQAYLSIPGKKPLNVLSRCLCVRVWVGGCVRACMRARMRVCYISNNKVITDYVGYIRRYTHPFNDPLSGTTQVSWYQNGKPIWILLEQKTVSGSGISWAICKSAPCSRQTTMPAPHHSVFYRPDALPATQPTVSKH